MRKNPCAPLSIYGQNAANRIYIRDDSEGRSLTSDVASQYGKAMAEARHHHDDRDAVPRRLHFWPARLVRAPLPRISSRPAPLSLALQGGGSFGAFTWGVLDRLLAAEEIAFDAVSGTSAGAVNAVALAAGLAQGGRAAARQALERVWRRLSAAAALTPFGSAAALFASPAELVAAALDLSSRIFSPYQFNPLALDPLRAILAEEVDFARLREASPVRLLIAATGVRDGRLRLFREREITLDAVLASSRLPLIHHAVAIDGEWYWDGGYTANPPLLPLVAVSQACDILLVQITPTEYVGHPMWSPQIIARLQQIAFNTPLLKEIEALAALQALCRREPGSVPGRLRHKLRRLRLHRIAAEDAVEGLAQASALDLDWRFLVRLRDGGRAAAERWLAERSRAGWP
jgi:NTE family protein